MPRTWQPRASDRWRPTPSVISSCKSATRLGQRSAYLEGLSLARQVLAAEPENTQWQADVVVSLWKVAAATTDRSARVSRLQEAPSFVDKLESRGALGADQRNWRAMIEAEIAKPAEEQPAPVQRRRTSARTTDGFSTRQH